MKNWKLIEDFYNFVKDFESWDEWIIDKYLNKVKDKKSNEVDLISEMINNKIFKIKWDKKSVLVLDDLDRIDPEHIFRILNIFWAHLDSKNDELPNKFWFDRIILVWDIENLRSIFYHKFWNNTDFYWYMDKFFSIEIYEYKNKNLIQKIVPEVLKKFKIEDSDIKTQVQQESYFVNLILSSVLEQASLVQSNKRLNLRQFLKWIKFDLNCFSEPWYNQWFLKNELNFKREDVFKIKALNSSRNILFSIFSWLKSDLVWVLKEIEILLELKPEEDCWAFFNDFSLVLLKYFNWKDFAVWSIIDDNFSVSFKEGQIKRIKSIKTGRNIGWNQYFFHLFVRYIEDYDN